MAFRLRPTDGELLKAVAECRIVTALQLAALLARSAKGVRDRTTKLIAEGLLAEVTRGRGQRRGRPERIVSLCESAVAKLKERGIIDARIPPDRIMGNSVRCQNNQLLLNWLRIFLAQIERVLPQLEIRFLAHNSPFVPVEFSCLSITTDMEPELARPQRVISIKPDAIFSICDRDRDKTLLFFLEIDLGTETLASPQRELTDIRQKILNYGMCFDHQIYKRYEKLWDRQLNGFRLLFITDSLVRLNALSSLVQEMPPSDFIWLTEHARMFKDGISGEIWARGGRLDVSPQSILGRLACRIPLS
ncbi:MAG: replication-relaxation family protein [Phycisphaerae bacterium]|nr:replication-relaxation family protein [Phycisphaerae bacterium]